MEREKILEALHIIKDVCTEQSESCGDCCHRCPFGDGGGNCKIMDKVPSEWEIGPTEVWRAFE